MAKVAATAEYAKRLTFFIVTLGALVRFIPSAAGPQLGAQVSRFPVPMLWSIGNGAADALEAAAYLLASSGDTGGATFVGETAVANGAPFAVECGAAGAVWPSPLLPVPGVSYGSC